MVEKHRRQPIWIAGDLNLPDIDWEGLTISGHQYLKAINQTFLPILERTDLEQVVDFPTRLAASGKWAYLDLLITNRPGLFHKCLATPGISDHTSIINAEIDCFAQVERPIRRKVHCWKKANIEELQAYIMREVTALTESHSDDTEVESLWQQIKRISEEGMEKFVPSKMTSKRYSQPWFTRKYKRAIRKKIVPIRKPNVPMITRTGTDSTSYGRRRRRFARRQTPTTPAATSTLTSKKTQNGSTRI